ncbi:uncharacterized protein LY79DRAFT_569672, partial [Colletotrichum navitas]
MVPLKRTFNVPPPHLPSEDLLHPLNGPLHVLTAGGFTHPGTAPYVLSTSPFLSQPLSNIDRGLSVPVVSSPIVRSWAIGEHHAADSFYAFRNAAPQPNERTSDFFAPPLDKSEPIIWGASDRLREELLETVSTYFLFSCHLSHHNTFSYYECCKNVNHPTHNL